MSDDRVVLTAEQALSMLGEGELIHTFRSGPFMLIGCDWTRDRLEEAIRLNECEIGGEKCQRMNHGLIVHVGDDPLFVECREGLDYAEFEKQVVG